MNRKIYTPVWLLLCGLRMISPGPAQAQDRPNILWLVSEDNSPFLGCYGDTLAETPRLDQLAREGIMYNRAYANAPVCSSSRSTLIHGSYSLRYGIHHHRSAHPVPVTIRPYPEYFKKEGYYITNNSKKDYNLIDDFDCWDESSPQAHYTNRGEGQPFFAVFNFAESHESRTFPPDVARKRTNGVYPPESRVSPQDIQLPAYHPDHPDIRQEWADYYDAVSHMDDQIGKRLDELEQSGLKENTIIVYYADHGGALARGKRSVKESGTRIPLIIWFPDKWKHLAPAKPGEAVDRLVSLVDLPATMLSLAGAAIPDQMDDAVPFLGAAAEPAREYVFLYRGRMDARYDMVRAVKTDSFRYIVNYTPYRPAGQHYNYAEQSRITPQWRALWQAGVCSAAQSYYWELKSAEELYCTLTDPDEVHNLIDDPGMKEKARELRQICHEELLRIRDVGFIPESRYAALAGDSTLFEFARSKSYNLKYIKKVADRAISGDPKHIAWMQRRMHDRDPLVRYWAVTASLVLGKRATLHQGQLKKMLADPWPEIRILAAEALARQGEQEMALKQLLQELEYHPDTDPHVYTYAANALLHLDTELLRAHTLRIQEIAADTRYGNGSRVAQGLLDVWKTNQ